MAPPKSKFEAKSAVTAPAATPPPVAPEITPEITAVETNPALGLTEPELAALEAPPMVGEVAHEIVEAAQETLTAASSIVELSIEAAAPLQEVTETAVHQAKAFAEESIEAVEEAAATAPAGLSALGLKAVENACVNASAYLDHVNDLIGAKSIPDVIELNTSFARKVAETLTAQAREFGEIAQRTASDATGSIKARLERVFKLAA